MVQRAVTLFILRYDAEELMHQLAAPHRRMSTQYIICIDYIAHNVPHPPGKASHMCEHLHYNPINYKLQSQKNEPI